MAMFKGMLSLGLVNVPIEVSPAAREEKISFNLLHQGCGQRIKQKRVCPTHGEIEWNDTDKGYEYAKDTYLAITKEELKGYEPASTKTIEITQTVEASEIDPLLFEKSYYLAPEPAGKKGYRLVFLALANTALCAVAKMTMSGKEHTVIIRPLNDCLVAHTMFYEDEVRSTPALGLAGVDIRPQELELAEKLLQLQKGEFDHSKYADEYQKGVAELIAAKQAGEEPRPTPRKPQAAETQDLLSALEASLNASKPAPGPRAVPSPAAKKRKAS